MYLQLALFRRGLPRHSPSLKKQGSGMQKEHLDSFIIKTSATTTENPVEALERLKEKYRGCMECPLATQGRKQVVFGEGNPFARLMFVGEGPGRDEDIKGRPFVGRAGELLNKIIEAMGLARSEVYISNVVKCRPPENRVPLPNESSACTSRLLFKEIEIIKPEIICTLGVTATRALLGEITMSRVRGVLQTYKEIPVMPTYHPAYLLDRKSVV